MKKNCSCKKCISCCWHSPGWFGSIREIQGAAKLMKMNTKDFCKEYLIEEWWASDKSDISVPAPRRDFTRIADKSWFKDLGAKPMEFLLQMEIKRNGKGFVKASWSHNLITGVACIFLDKNNKCLIHKSKPEECRTSFGCGSKKENGNNRVAVLAYWKKHQDWIEKII